MQSRDRTLAPEADLGQHTAGAQPEIRSIESHTANERNERAAARLSNVASVVTLRIPDIPDQKYPCHAERMAAIPVHILEAGPCAAAVAAGLTRYSHAIL